MLLREVEYRALPDVFRRNRGNIEEGLVLSCRSAAHDALLHEPAEYGPDGRIGHALAQALLDVFRSAAAELVHEESDFPFGRSEAQHDLRRALDLRADIQHLMHAATLQRGSHSTRSTRYH